MEDDKIINVKKNLISSELDLFYLKYNVDEKQGSALKSLTNCWSKIIDKSIQDGNSHFAITINLPNNPILAVDDYISSTDYNDSSYYPKDNILDFSGYSRDFYNLKDEFGNYVSLQYTNGFSRDNIFFSIYTWFYNLLVVYLWF